MLKNISRLEKIINGRVYQLLCDMDSPVVDAREALNQFDQCLMQIEETAKAQQAAAQAAPEAIEEAIVE